MSRCDAVNCGIATQRDPESRCVKEDRKDAGGVGGPGMKEICPRGQMLLLPRGSMTLSGSAPHSSMRREKARPDQATAPAPSGCPAQSTQQALNEYTAKVSPQRPPV